jgi:hypothetical protein
LALEAMIFRNEAMDKNYEESCAQARHYQSSELLKGVDTHPTKVMTWEEYTRQQGNQMA